jgi:ABC-type multidrug transport system ATPase subunit
VGYVPQGTPLLQELTARDNLRLWYEKDALQRSLEEGILHELGVKEFLGSTAGKPSGGMKKRLSIGCAMANAGAAVRAAADRIVESNNDAGVGKEIFRILAS